MISFSLTCDFKYDTHSSKSFIYKASFPREFILSAKSCDDILYVLVSLAA